jgi:hypothetical protein
MGYREIVSSIIAVFSAILARLWGDGAVFGRVVVFVLELRSFWPEILRGFEAQAVECS